MIPVRTIVSVLPVLTLLSVRLLLGTVSQVMNATMFQRFAQNLTESALIYILTKMVTDANV